MAVENEFKESTVTTTNHTVNYDLPLWAGDDATSWLTQVNDAMNKIDSGIYEAKQSSHEVVTIAENAQKLEEETKAESDASAKIVEGYDDRLKVVESTTAEHTTDLTNLNQRVDTQDTEIHSLQEVDKTILVDIGTLQTDIEGLQTEITQVGRVLKLLGTVSTKISAEISSTDGTGVLHIGGLYAWVYGNGVVVVNWSGYNSTLFAMRHTSGANNTLTFDLSSFFDDLLTKARELYENPKLKFQYISTTQAINSFNITGTSITPTNGVFTQEESHSITNNTHRLLLTPSLMFNSSTDATRFVGWQTNARYELALRRTLFIAYEEV